jgi:ATP-binding cassette subfamily B protein
VLCDICEYRQEGNKLVCAVEAWKYPSYLRLAEGRTVISVTHRLSTVVKTDRIFVMDRGQLAESGSHGELLARNGLYARLWNKQSGVHVEAGSGRARVDGALLAAVPLLAGASEATRAELTGWFATERFDGGREIFRQGDAGERLYIIVHGTVEVVWEDTRQVLAKLSDGDYFGEMALLSDEPRNATVRTLGPCLCLTLQRDQFQLLLTREPVLREKIEQVTAERSAARD